MKEALFKKRFGIPAFVLVILIASGAVAAAGGFATFKLTSAIRYPTHEKLSIDLGNISAGYSRSGTAEGFLGLPDASYDLSWTLSGDLAKFSSVSIEVWVDMNNDTNYSGTEENIGVLTKDTKTISKLIVSGPLATKAKYDVSVTAKDNVVKTGISIVSEDTTLTVNWNAVKVETVVIE